MTWLAEGLGCSLDVEHNMKGHPMSADDPTAG